MGKKKKTDFKSFDGYNRRYTNLNYDVLSSPALLDCSKGARLLYVCMRAEQYGTSPNKHPNGNDEQFIFTMKHYNEKWHLSKNRGQFIKERDELINHGLIECVEDNSHIRLANVYTYSSNWRHYNGQNVNTAHITKSMRNQIKSKQQTNSEKCKLTTNEQYEKSKKQPKSKYLDDNAFCAVFGVVPKAGN